VATTQSSGSKRILGTDNVLVTYEDREQPGAVVALLNREGETVRARQLIVTMEVGRKDAVTAVRLVSIRRYRHGYKVHMIGHWDEGGHEGGLIYLDKDLNFEYFRIGW
jgi:hypothetical protein